MYRRTSHTVLGALLALSAFTFALAAPDDASAFCGTYVSGGGAELFNNATQVVMMRDGKQTVLSMQNDYQGPPKDFAMVVPTPQVLEKEDVKTIEDKVFDRIDRLTAPRLVEYWEQDPCRGPRGFNGRAASGGDAAAAPEASGGGGKVDIEAQFDVGEYEVVVLSSSESSALQNWLTNNGYNIPDGAAPYLRPYINQGQYFFVAKVDTDKVTFKDGRAVLSPLRFHYESDQFKLPVRLGLINSSGKQDLIVNILARDQRYRVANYPNTTIPTNRRVKEEVKGYFPSFYRALFRRTLEQNKGPNGRNPVVTEYSWDASSCDPCPGPALRREHFLTLGADVIEDVSTGEDGADAGSGAADAGAGAPPRRRPPVRVSTNWTITRLHARYDANTLGEDLVFEKAPAIRGGRGQPGDLKKGAQENAQINRFQGRYIITHPWEGEVDCEDPQYGRWGGKNGSSSPSTQSVPSRTNQSAQSGSGGGGGNSKSPDEVDLDSVFGSGKAGASSDKKDSGEGCGCSAGDSRWPRPIGLATVLALAAFVYLRRRE